MIGAKCIYHIYPQTGAPEWHDFENQLYERYPGSELGTLECLPERTREVRFPWADLREQEEEQQYLQSVGFHVEPVGCTIPRPLPSLRPRLYRQE